MNREIHVRFWESLGVQFPWATHFARQVGQCAFACEGFCSPLCATARAVAVLRVCGVYQGLCMALGALQFGPPDWVRGHVSLPALWTTSPELTFSLSHPCAPTCLPEACCCILSPPLAA